MRRSALNGRRRIVVIVGVIFIAALLCSLLLSRAATVEDTTRLRGYVEVSSGDGWVRDDMRKNDAHKQPFGEGVLIDKEGDVKKRNECSEGYDTSCRNPMLHVRIGAETEKRPPFTCLNDISVFSSTEISRGLLAASLDPDTLEIVEVATFEVSTTDGRLIEWTNALPARAVIVVLSFGDVAERISPDARRTLQRFGADRISEWRGGSSYALMGQRGLLKGIAKEILSPLGSSHPIRSISDCLSFPLGSLNATIDEGKTVNRVDEKRLAELLQNGEKVRSVRLGDEWPECGRTMPCGEDLLSMHFYSGANKDDHPRMCIGGRMVFASGLNDAGRGLNVVVIDQKTRKVVRTGHFDTYQNDSTNLELFLDGLIEGDIVAVVSFDEASTMLSDMAKQIFYELGSSMVHRLKFRASWFFVGQKGIRVFSPFEDLNFPSGNAWATPIDTSLCVPLSLSGPTERRSGKQNAAKRHFCAKYDRLDEFCEESHLDDPIIPRPLSDTKRAEDAIFNVPIIVVGGVNLARLRWTLDSLIAQEGINTQLVIVAHHKDYRMAGDMALLFHFKPLPINASSLYNDLVLDSISAAFSIFPKASSVIVVEGEVAASPDLLLYFSQLLPVFEQDPSLDMVHTFNYNGFTRTSGNESIVYRVENQQPGYIFLMKRSFYDREIDGKNRSVCCTPLHQWPLSSSSLVPDISRVSIPRPNDITIDQREAPVFKESRRFSKNGTSQLIGVSELASSAIYERSLKKKEKEGMTFDGSELARCEGGYTVSWNKMKEKSAGRSIIIRYSNTTQLDQLISCLGLYRSQSFVAGFWHGRLRFHLEGSPAILVPEK